MYPVKSRSEERAREGRGPLESASFPSGGPNAHTPSGREFDQLIKRLFKSPAAQFPLRPTRFWFACDNRRRLPSCGPYTEQVALFFHTSSRSW